MRKRSRTYLPNSLYEKNRGKKGSRFLQERNDFDEFVDEGVGVAKPYQMLGLNHEQISSIYEEALHFLTMYEVDKAITGFQLLCSLCPYDAECWIGLGKAFRQKEDFRAALSSFLMAETLDPAFFEAYKEAIICCVELKLPSEAYAILKRCKKEQKMCEQAIYGESLRSKIEELEKVIHEGNLSLSSL